jgi:tRNA threonylcarbamoyladenosine biosynthesis protein TsaB
MNLLALETSTEACSVALLCGDQVRERFEIAPRRHTELVLPWIDALLADAALAKTQIDAIAVSRGPGAFTGVRLGISIAQGIGYALDRPLLPVSTLAALACEAQAASGEWVLAAIDARMGEIYVGEFRIDPEGLPAACGDEHLVAPDAAAVADDGDWIGVGSGFDAGDAALVRALEPRLLRVDSNALPHAAAVVRLALPAWRHGAAIAAADVEPAYLRDRVAQTLAERGKG